MFWLLLISCDDPSGTAKADDTSSSSTDDTATGGGSEADCDATWDDSAPGGPDCASGVISCGDVIEASTSGGSTTGSSDLYESAYCFVPGQDHDGEDRFYVFEAAEGQEFSITLESPCEPLSIAAMRWDEAECPVDRNHNIGTCDGFEAFTGTNTLDMYTTNAGTYYIAVDAASGVTGNFTLSLTCSE